ncbi:MAG TPA: alpha/beta hydrolase-fold protein [Bryobacteraceae bacterium]|nr:alpha/beta hydrolase-fold protein [Bryobacteraceae bacterium]
MFRNPIVSIRGAAFASAALALTILQAQPPNQTPGQGRGRGIGRGGPAVVSPHIESDGRVTFRIYAPQASAVTVNGDIAGGLVPAEGSAPTPAVTMTKGADGIWSGVTVRAVKPGAWRYTFGVDGATTVDSRNTLTSPSQTQVQSLLVIPGDFSETRDVPHGAVSQVRYVASALSNARREMYVYTPPGYEKGAGIYPVLYLIHGGGDTALSWSTIGRANDILDNLVTEKKAKPMIIVMPSGWTPSGGQVMTSDANKDPFNAEMLKDILPYIESHYRTRATADSRALSGLSMGGIQTLNTGLHNIGTFSYIAVMSSGWISEEDRQFFYKSEAAKIPTYNSKLKLFWWGWGQTDIARENGLAVINTLKNQGVRIETMETPGGHEWANWRLYLHEIAPKLFQ